MSNLSVLNLGFVFLMMTAKALRENVSGQLGVFEVDICIQNLKYKSQNSRKDSQYLMFLKD
jgi:hypothetical protein